MANENENDANIDDLPLEEQEQWKAFMIDALVGPKRVALYKNNVYFKNAIDHLAYLLPAMIDGVAAACDNAQVDLDKANERIMKEVPTIRITEDELRAMTEEPT